MALTFHCKTPSLTLPEGREWLEKKTDNKPAKKGRKKSVKIEKTEEIIKRVSDETAVFAEGMSIKGDVESDGSLELCGSIEGDIDIAGKLKVSGIIKGNTTAVLRWGRVPSS